MRTTERLRKLKAWTQSELCDGREMKAPSQDLDCSKITYRKPKCFLGWAPARADESGKIQEDILATCPGIIIMPNQAYAKHTEEKRFDRYNNIYRPQELGQQLSVSMLFSIYEPGIRLPGFAESVGEHGQGADMSLMLEGTEEGLLTLLDWMDDCLEKLIGQKAIPHTDLAVEEDSITYSLYTDQSYVVDKRPIYYGFINVIFDCIANDGANPAINDYLK